MPDPRGHRADPGDGVSRGGAVTRLGLGGPRVAHAQDPTPESSAQPDGDQDGQARVDTAGWTHGTGLLTRVVSWVMVLALLAGPVALVMMLRGGQGSGPVVPAAMPAEDLQARRVAASEVATQWVMAWLAAEKETGEELVGAYWAAPVELPEDGTDVLSASPVSEVATGPGVWTVTVGADVLLEAGVVRRYYDVPVSVEGGAVDAAAAVLSLPVPVAGPGRAAPGGGAGYGTRVSTGEPGFEAVEAFVQAWLTGQGDLDRWTTPGSVWEPVGAPYAAVELEELSAQGAVPGAGPTDGDQVQVLADLVLTDVTPESAEAESATFSRAGVRAQMALTLTARAGRWEVSGIDPAPATTPSAQEQE